MDEASAIRKVRSLNKMVLSKSNEEWTMKSDRNLNNTNTNNFGAGNNIIFVDVKEECANVSSTYQGIVDVAANCYALLEERYSEESCSSTASSKKRKIETPEQRAARLAKMSAYAAKRLANETNEQRAKRLSRMSEYAAKRLAKETNEQRAKRLARMSAYAAKKLSQETPEQRKLRLSRMSAYAARRHAMKKYEKSFSPDHNS